MISMGNIMTYGTFLELRTVFEFRLVKLERWRLGRHTPLWPKRTAPRITAGYGLCGDRELSPIEGQLVLPPGMP